MPVYKVSVSGPAGDDEIIVQAPSAAEARRFVTHVSTMTPDELADAIAAGAKIEKVGEALAETAKSDEGE